MNIGIIGVGNMGKNHLRVCSEIDTLNIVGIVDLNEDLGMRLSKQFNTKYFKNYQDLINLNQHLKLDFVIIAVPTTYHYEIAKYFIKNNVNVLIEKPVCKTLDEVNKLIDLQLKYNVKVMVGHIERFNPVIKKLKEIIDNKIGEPISFTIQRVGLYPQITDTGIILDLGIHDYDMCTYLFGDITNLYTMAESIHGKNEDCSFALVKINDINGFIENSWLTPYKLRKISVVGTNGVVNADLINMKLSMQNDEQFIDYKIKIKEPLKAEIEHFIECIKNNIKPLITLQDGKNALDIALLSVESYKNNKIISRW